MQPEVMGMKLIFRDHVISCDCHVTSYEDQNGRESVIEFFSLLFAKFPDVSLHITV